jgi:peptide/nickel transport system permease protein
MTQGIDMVNTGQQELALLGGPPTVPEGAVRPWPEITQGDKGAGWYARTLRSTMLDVLGMDYVRTARAKGVRALSIALRHVLRNALGPIVTNLGLDMASFLGGVLVVETVFSWPGIGLLGYEAIGYHDVPMLMGTVLFSALSVVLVNLIIDLSYGFVDPRVRYT